MEVGMNPRLIVIIMDSLAIKIANYERSRILEASDPILEEYDRGHNKNLTWKQEHMDTGT